MSERLRVRLVAANPDRFSLGLAYLECALHDRMGGRADVEQLIFDSADVRGQTELAAAITAAACDGEPDVIGLSWYCWSHQLMQDVARQVATRLPGCRLVVGGPEALTIDEAQLLMFPTGTVFSFGEGEHVLADLVEAIASGEDALPEGTGCHDGRQVVRANRAARSVVLDEIPSPVLTGTLRPASTNWLPSYTTGRGCVYSCSFCGWHDGRGQRTFSLARVLDELDVLADAGYDRVWITDTIFGRHEERALAVLEHLERWPGHTRFAVELHARFLSERLADGLARIPLAWAAIGIQSLAPGVLRLTRRSPRTDELIAAVRRLYDRLKDRAAIHLDLIFGLPDQTLEDCYATIDTLLEQFPDATLFTSMLQVLPGTEFEALRGQPGWVVLPPARDCEVLTTPHLDAADAARLRHAMIGLDAHTVVRSAAGSSLPGSQVSARQLERLGASLDGTDFAAHPPYGRRERFGASDVTALVPDHVYAT